MTSGSRATAPAIRTTGSKTASARCAAPRSWCASCWAGAARAPRYGPATCRTSTYRSTPITEVECGRRRMPRMPIPPSLSQRLDDLLQRLEPLLPPADAVDWTTLAFQWRRRSVLGGSIGRLEPVRHIAAIRPEDLRHVDAQKQAILRNTEQFVRGLPANNVLLTGARGTGKSSLVRACLSSHATAGLRLIEVDRHDLIDLPEIVARLEGRPERFVPFCDA